MESIANSAEDLLINGLSFKLPPGASYVLDRKSSTFWAVGSNAYTPVGGVKLIKFQLNGDDGNWLDPSSVVFQFELVNTDVVDDHFLRPVGQPHLFFKRVRVLAGGQVVEDIQDFGRNMELITSLQNEFVRDNNDIQGFGSRWDASGVQDLDDLSGVVAAFTGAVIKTKQRDLLPALNARTSKIVNFKPLLGIFNQHKYLPLKFVPIVLEFELCDINDAIVFPRAYAEATGYNTIYTTDNTTNSWQIQNCCIKCDICTLDNALNNSYNEHLLAGKALPLEYSTFISQQSSVFGKNFSVQIIRAVSKLQKAFITFYIDPTNALPFQKPTITFHHPMSESPTYTSTKELQIYMQLGSKLYPEYPCNNIAECFYRLKQALNLPELHQHSISIKFKNYIKNKFIFAIDFEKIPDAEWSGVNTKAGQILMVNCKAMNEAGITNNNIASTMYTLLEVQQILEIRDIGCTVFD